MILLVDNQDSFVYNIVGLLKCFPQFEFEIKKNNQLDLSSINKYSKIILSPGPGIPSEAGDMLKLIEKTYSTHQILGICLGHQAIVEFFGGSIKNMPLAKHGHASKLKIIDNKDILLKDLPTNPIIGRYHSWVADNVSDELIVSSVDEDNNIMSVYHKTHNIHSLQFHPESIITNCRKQIISNWLNQ